jgi:WD40 repeat protein
MDTKRSSELTPRTRYSKQLEEEEELLIDLTMNFEPLTISMLKKEFENSNDSLDLQSFVMALREHLKNWRLKSPNRDKVIVKLLVQLFKDIDMNGNGTLEWDEFTNYIIEKATTLSALKKNRVDAIKSYSQSNIKTSFHSDKMIEKLINMESLDRVGVIEDFSNVVKFYNPDTGQVIGRDLVVKSEDFRSNRKDNEEIINRGPKRTVVSNSLFLSDPNMQILLTCCNDGTIRSWTTNGSHFHSTNYEGGNPILRSKTPQKSLAWDNTSNLLYSGDNVGVINLWNYSDSKRSDPIKSLCKHDDMVTDLIAVPKLEFLISCSQDRKVILWDMISTTPRRIYGNHTKGVLSLAFNQEYRLLFSAGFDHDIYVWNPYIDSVAFTIEGHNSSLVGVKVIPDSPQVISADIDGWVKIWDIRNLSCVQTFNLEEKQSGFRFALSDFIYLQNHQRLVFGGKTLTFYDYDKNHNPYLVDDNLPLASYYTPTYHKILTPISNKVKVWNALTATPETLYAPSAESEISYVEMDEWEKRILVGDIRGHTRVYNIKNGAMMKSLFDHRSEINCISCSKNLQIIATGSLDMTIMLHDDRYLTESNVLKTISLGSVITVLRLVPTLNFLISGSSEGFASAYNIEDSCEDGVPMTHQGEILTIQIIQNYPICIICDSYGEIVLWALHPLPYKYNRIFSIQNQDSNGNPVAVMTSAYDHENHILFLGDEKGYVKAYSFKDIINYLKFDELSPNPKENKSNTFAVRSHLTIPAIPSFIVEKLYQVKAHVESVRHVFLIRDPLTVITTGYDRRVKMFAARDGTLVGGLHQGIASLRSKSIKKESENIIPWNFFLDVEKLERDDKNELEEMYEKVKILESNKKDVSGDYLHFKGLGGNFIEPHHPNKQSRNNEPEDYEKQFRPISPKSLLVSEKKKLKPAIKQQLLDPYNSNKAQLKEKIELSKIKNKSRHIRNRLARLEGIPKVPSLPSIIQAYRADSVNIIRDIKKKLSKAAYNSAIKLSKALDEIYF